MKPVTIVIPYEDEEGPQEKRYAGFLTGGSCAIFYIPEHGKGSLVFSKVENTEDPLVFIDVSKYQPLGEIHEENMYTVTKALAKKLHSMTAYEIFEQVLVHVKYDIEFEDWIIPKLVEH